MLGFLLDVDSGVLWWMGLKLKPGAKGTTGETTPCHSRPQLLAARTQWDQVGEKQMVTRHPDLLITFDSSRWTSQR